MLTSTSPLKHRSLAGKYSLRGMFVQSLTNSRKLNTSPSTIEDKDVLKKLLCTPPIKKIDLHFPLGLEVTARNMRGVTIKDAMDAIHKQFKKKVCDMPHSPQSRRSPISISSMMPPSQSGNLVVTPFSVESLRFVQQRLRQEC